jgi:hypothetical protein
MSNLTFFSFKMPFKIFRFSILTFFIISISSCSGPKTEEDLANEVMETFKNDDHRSFKNLYVKKMDIEALINDSSIPDDMKNNVRKDLKAKSTFFRVISKLEFNSTRYRAYEQGVNWQNVEIVEVKSTVSNSLAFFNFGARLMEESNIEVKDIDITFVSDRDTFNMHLDNCIKTKSRGWCLSEEVRIRRKNYFSNF